MDDRETMVTGDDTQLDDERAQDTVGGVPASMDGQALTMLQRALEHAHAPVVGFDKDGCITVWNQWMEKRTAYRFEDVVHQPIEGMLVQDIEDTEHVVQMLHGLSDDTPVAKDWKYACQLHICGRNGAKASTFALSFTPQIDEHGEFCSVIGIGQEITEQEVVYTEHMQMLAAAHAPCIAVDTEARIVFLNHMALEISEYSMDEIQGKDLVSTLVSKPCRRHVTAVLKRALSGQQTARYEFVIQSKSGRRIELLMNAAPRRGRGGDITGVLGIGQDITEYNMLEREYNRLIETANAPIFAVDQQYQVVLWNREATTITEYSVDDAMGEKLINFVSHNCRESVEDVLDKAMKGEETANFEFPLISKSGRRLNILLNAAPRVDHCGNIVGVVGIGQDITDRRAQEQEYTRLIDTANAPIFGVDVEGHVNIWNKNAAHITEYSVFDVMGSNLVEEFIPPDYQLKVGEVLAKALKGIETANFEFPLLTRTGRRLELLLNATTRYDEKGEIIGMVGIGQDITIRIAQEQEYMRLIDTANAPIFGVDKDGCVNIWNKKTAEISQYSFDDVVGKDLVQHFISQEYRVSVGSVLSEALQGVQTANFNFALTTKTGRRVEILMNSTPRYNELGEIVGVVGIGQDITERIAQEQEYARLIDTANAPIFGVDEEGRVNIWNRKAADITQYAPADVMGENLVEKFVTEDYREAVGFVLTKTLNGTETANFEFPLITKTGRLVQILLNATPRFTELGKVKGMVGIGQDITERIAQEQEYARLIRKANAPIFGVDVDGCVNIWNRKAAEITQYDPAEVLGQNLVETFISEDVRDAVADVLSRALRGDESANFELPLITKAGRKVIFLLNATARFDQLGHIVGVVGIGQDITDRIAQEQELTRIIDAANAPIFGVDATGSVNIWNEKAAEITQYSSSDVMETDSLVFVTEDCREAVRGVLEKAMNGTATANFEFAMSTKTGRRVDILLNVTSRYSQLGSIVGVVAIGQDITERLAQEREYTRLIDTANAPIFGVDREGRVNIWNKKAAEITQYSPTDAMGQNLVEKFITEDYRLAVANVLTKALDGIERANFEFALVTKPGRRVNILLNATSRYNEHGSIVGVVGIGQDITDRLAQEREYSRLIDTANAPIFGVDKEGRVNIWNKKAAEITQYTPTDVMGQNLVEKFITADYRHAVAEVFSKALDGMETANFEFPLITKTGGRVVILLNATSRYNELGSIVGVVGIGQDITDRLVQERETSRLIDTANAPIFGVDKDGRVNIWNKKAAEITQYSSAETMGENLVETFITEEYRAAVGCVLSKALSGIETANFEFPLITKTGRQVDILLNATPRLNEMGNVIGMVGIGQDITERIAQEQEYARLIEKANAPIFGVDANGCVNIWNLKMAEITQHSLSEVVGLRISELVVADYREMVHSVVAKALAGDESSNVELSFTTKTDRTVNILLNATARFDQHTNIVGVVGIGQDLTDRIAQEEEYSRLIDTANAPIFGVDGNLCVNIWNKKAAQLTQYSTSEVMGENLVETFISPEFRPIVAEVLTKALSGKQKANFEFPLITRPGTRIEILLNATPRMDCHGNIVGVVGIGQDITDRIAQEHEYFRLIDTANAPIFGVDNYGCINEWNQKIEEITGHHKISVLGISLVDALINPENQTQVRLLINQALIGIDVGEMELPMITKAGKSILLLVNASSKKDMHGNIRGVIGVGQDYTAKKHMEAAKVNFLASFSHELRTPLNGVLGMLELLREQKLDKMSQRFVHVAYVSGSLLLNLINDILDLSKIEAGHLEISSELFQMHELLDYVIEIFKYKAREKKIKLHLECASNVPSAVIGDVSRLRQVLLNLLSNAVKFTSQGSIKVKCSVAPSPDLPKTCVKLLFQVIDTGIGMDEEERSRLFSIFTKLERMRKDNPTGSGLGLAISKQLVELMRGEIDIDSEIGKGSEFFFTVVVERCDEPDLIVPHSRSDSMSLAAYSSATDLVPKQARILVVEDNEFNWEVVKCFFYEDNHMLQWEQNGRDAVEAYEQHYDQYDMILMDCEMPIMDGYTATQNIRIFEEEHQLPRIPIIGVTAYAMSGDRKKCLDAGMDEFIVKPISKVALCNAIRQWMLERYLGQNGYNKTGGILLEDNADSGDAAEVNLVPASTHKERLDLSRAISDLELENPMMIGQKDYSHKVSDDVMNLSVLCDSKSLTSLGDVLSHSLADLSEVSSVTGLTQERIQLETSTGSPITSADENGENSLPITRERLEALNDGPRVQFQINEDQVKEPEVEIAERQESHLTVQTASSELAAASPRSPLSAVSSPLPESIEIPDSDPIDYAKGVEQCGGNESLFFNLLEKYSSVSDEVMHRIETAFVDGDYVVLRRESHSLKGSSAYVAAMRVSKAAFRVQVASERMNHCEGDARMEAAASLQNQYELLKKENRILQGYLRRNFSFRKTSGASNGDSKRAENNACSVM